MSPIIKTDNFILILLFLNFFVGTTKGEDPSFTIKLNNNTPVQYCLDPVLVAKNLTIEGNPTILGMKISFSQGYIPGEDELVYSGKLTQSWPTPETMILSGSSNIKDYEEAIRTINYKNSKSSPTLGFRKITISLSDVDYLPETQHFYRYVNSPRISWNNARLDAESNAMMYYGLRGYLATITSRTENDFIKLRTKGVGWIGATDEGNEGEWRWVTGPEGLLTKDDNIFWVGTGLNYRNGVTGNGPYMDRYNNWNTDEPNNSNNEDYAHILFSKNQSDNLLRWNDLPNAGGNGENDTPAGYLIEFGGLLGEPVVNLSATLDLQVNTVFFKTGIVAAICNGESVMLNQPDYSTATFNWTPSDALSSSSIANPVANPLITTKYTVTGVRGSCNNSATYAVTVNPNPISFLKAEENICRGKTVTLDAGNNQNGTYKWDNGGTTQKITVDASGVYAVTLISDNGCKTTTSTKVIVHEYPTIDLSSFEQLICNDSKVGSVNIKTNATSYTLESVDKMVSVNRLNVRAPAFGKYQMLYTANHQYCPSKHSFDLSFYKAPKVDFTVDAKKCSGYNLNVSYVGDADISVSNFNWVFDNKIIANETGLNTLVVPLGINRAQRDLSLTVTQDGCSNTYIQKNIKVIPNLDLKVVDKIGCEPFMAEFIAVNTEVVIYDWDFGDATPVERKDKQTSHLYQTSGYYNVKLKVTTIVPNGQGCVNEAKIDSMVYVAPIPDIGFSLSPDVCLNPGVNEISYSGVIGTNRDKYYWDLAHFDMSEIIDNPKNTKGPFRFNITTQPTANIGLKVISEFGCESVQGNIKLKRKPDFSIESNVKTGCAPLESFLKGIINDSVDKVDFNWDFGDSSAGSGMQVSHIYQQPDTNYNLTLSGKSTITGCNNILVNNNLIRTYPKPEAAFSMDNKVVYNDKPDINFTDSSVGASAWLWNFGDGGTSAVQNPAYHFVNIGSQKVVLEVTNDEQCTDTISHVVLVAFDRLFPPNGFSPNSPSNIDRIFLINSEGITSEGYHFIVLSRWNDPVFESTGDIMGWDGRMKNGTFAPAGIYVWILNFTDFLGKKHRQTGTVTLVY